MNAEVKTIDVDPDFQSVGQAAAKVVDNVPRQDMAVWDAQHRSVTPMACWIACWPLVAALRWSRR
jgi:hypothetical protein